MPFPIPLFAVFAAGAAQPQFAWPEPEPESASVVVEDGLTLDALSRVDTRGTARAVSILARTIAELPAEDRQAATESLQFLVVNCPFTRAAMQLPFALHSVAMELDPGDFERVVASDIGLLEQGLATHVALLEALGVGLSLPESTDALGAHDPALFVDRDTLDLAADPLATTGAFVAALPHMARSIDTHTHDAIEFHSDRLEALTGIGRPCPRDPWTVLPGHPWTLGMQLAGWGDAFTRIAPFATEPQTAARIEEVLAVLDDHGKAAFVGRFSPAPL